MIKGVPLENMVIAQVGVENFGAYRRRCLREAGCFRLAAVCDRDPAALARAAAAEDAAPYADYAEMLEHPGLEGVVVSTGADSHAALALAALRRGLHVFIEKPLCCSRAEVEELRGAQRESGLVVGVGHNACDHDPLLRLAKRYIDDGLLGTLCAVEDNTSHSGGLEIKPGDWRGLAGRNPGGMLFQCGCHALHALRYLCGPVAAVAAMMRHDAHPDTSTADAANVLLRFASGVVGTLSCYHVTGYCHELRLFGTRGNLYIDTHNGTAHFQARRRNEAEPRAPVEIPPREAAQRYAGLVSWRDAVRGGPPARPGLEDGAAAVLTIFAADESARAGRLVEL